jgi:hypothetical protein
MEAALAVVVYLSHARGPLLVVARKNPVTGAIFPFPGGNDVPILFLL